MQIASHSEVTLTCSLTIWDRIRANLLLMSRRGLTIVFATVWVAIGIGLIILYLYKGLPLTAYVWTVSIGCILFAPVMVVIDAVRTHLNMRSREPFTYTFNDTGIHISAVTYEYTHRWTAISRVRVLGGFLMFFFSPGCAHCMPMRDVIAAGALEPLLKLAETNGVSVAGT
jgi:hypothetical protein